MKTEGTIELLQTAGSLIGLFALWFFCWRRYALDKFRQELFAVRDELFDVALRHREDGFSFDSPAYGTLRRQIHASIRFAHRVNMIQVLLFMFFRRLYFSDVNVPDQNIDRGELLGNVDDSVQADIMTVLCQWDNAVISYLMRTSPLFYATWFTMVVKLLMEKVLEQRKASPKTATSGVSSVVWTDVALADANSEVDEESMMALAR